MGYKDLIPEDDGGREENDGGGRGEDDLDGFVRDFDHPHFDNDFTDFDGKVEAVYLEHTGARAKSEVGRPRTASHRRPISADKTKASAASNGAHHERAEYKPRVSDSVLKEVRNTLTPSFNSGSKKAGSVFHAEPTRIAMNRPATASSIGEKARRIPRSSEDYLRDRRKKLRNEKKEQDDTVSQCLRELHYGYLYKMGELNEWSAALQLPTLYRAYKKPDGDLECHVYEDGVFLKQLSMNLLEKRHKIVQGRYLEATARGTIEWDETKPRTFALSEEAQTRRQEEIRDVLLQTMHLTNKLKEQLSTLEKRGVMISPFVVE